MDKDQIHAVFKRYEILRMSRNKKELEDYIDSFPEEERQGLVIRCQFNGVAWSDPLSKRSQESE